MDWSAIAAQQFQVRSLNFTVLKPFEELEGEGGGSLLSDLVTLFLRVGPEDLANLRSAVFSQNLGKVHQLAHGFKSSGANLGAETVAELCQKLEDQTDPEFNPAEIDLRSVFTELEMAYRMAERDLKIVGLLLQNLPVPEELARVS